MFLYSFLFETGKLFIYTPKNFEQLKLIVFVTVIWYLIVLYVCTVIHCQVLLIFKLILYTYSKLNKQLIVKAFIFPKLYVGLNVLFINLKTK